MQTITTGQYNELKTKQTTYQEWAKQYIQKNGWTVIPADAQPPIEFNNDDRSTIELYEWHADPPESYFLYIRDNDEPGNRQWTAVNWMGELLGNVQHGRKWRDNFGGVRVPITVYGNNGVKYHGTYYKSSGDYARIKRAKH